MAKFDVTIEDANVAIYSAFCSGDIPARLALLVNGDVATALAYAAQTDEAAKAAKIAAQEAYEAKIAVMGEKEKVALEALLAGKTVEEATTAATAEEPKP